jgi:hypothetical protein
LFFYIPGKPPYGDTTNPLVDVRSVAVRQLFRFAHL